jgi:thioredoxin reductase (NADPH)
MFATSLRWQRSRLFAHPKIDIRWNCEVGSFVGKSDPAKVGALVLKDRATGTIEQFAVDGVFVAIGHAPASALLEGKVELHADGYIKAKPGTTTWSVPGLFAAGDVADGVYRQAVTAAGLGCMAALEADRFLTVHAVSDASAISMEAIVA